MPFNFRALPVENLTGVTEDLEQLIAFLAPEAFKSVSTNLGFEHAWKNLEAGRKAEYRKRLLAGIVELRGSIASGEIGKSAFKLPLGYRPKENKDFPVVTASGVAGRVKVLATGEVEINEPEKSEPKVTTFLDAVRFSVE